MSTICGNSVKGYYSAKDNVKPVNFYCAAPGATRVCLAGDFNSWSPTAAPMQRRVDGWWFLQLLLPHGHHRYHFVVDGKPMLDPQASGNTLNEQKERVSIVAVS